MRWGGGHILRSVQFFAVAITGLFALTGCAHRGPPAFTYYDQCAAQTSSFVAMAECGKQARNAACQANSNCSPGGNAFVQYADALATQVKNREISDGEAQRTFVEYKTKLFAEAQHNQAMIAAGAAASGPTTCTRIGNTVNCY